MHCVLCRTIFTELDELDDINNKTPFSKKPIYNIIIYLAEKTTPPIDVSWLDQAYEQQICKICLGDILAYDEYMVKILEVQKRIVLCLRKIKEEEFDDIQALDECVDDIDEQIEKVEISLHQFEASDDCDNSSNLFHNEIEIKHEIDDAPTADEPKNTKDSCCSLQKELEIDELEEEFKECLDDNHSYKDGINVKNQNDSCCFPQKELEIDEIELEEDFKVFLDDNQSDKDGINVKNQNVSCSSPPKQLEIDEIELVEDFKEFLDDNQSDKDEINVKNKGKRNYKIPVQCNSCGKMFKNKSTLRRHVNVVHKTAKPICKCDICGVTTKDEEYLELHMNIHDGKTDLECRYCNKRYTKRINVIRHMQKHWDKKKFQCERCGLRFSERPMYYNHRLQHDAEEDPLICPLCNQSFKTRRTYRNHLWTHRADRPRFSCEVCGKTFVERYTLKVHMRIHNEKEAVQYECPRKTSKIVQQEKKKFECIICGNQFLTNESVEHHMKVEHDVILKAENIFV